ncbi:MAG: dihydrofolate reductase [Bacteroidales bacterium]|nr:dihydrofolate reductase [Bacteroidales bacterium]
MISLVIAVASNGAIGKQQDLLCYLPNDLKRFKAITLGHTIVMGRRTFESLPKGALPGRTNVVVTRQADASWENTIVVHTIDEVLADSAEKELFVIGGGTLYAQTLDRADRLYITHIHHEFADADTFFPAVNYEEWEVIEREEHEADERHPYTYSFVTYQRK